MRRMLIVEPNDSITDFLMKQFRNQFEIYTCDCGKEACRLLDRLRPDVLILDLFLPNMDGLSVLRKTAYRPPAIIAITRFVSRQVMAEASAFGIHETVLLPCSAGYIAETVRRLQNSLIL